MQFSCLSLRSVLGKKKKISGECVHLLNYFHPTAHAMWKRALSACLFAYDAVVRAPVRRDGAWAVFGLKRIKVSVKQGRTVVTYTPQFSK